MSQVNISKYNHSSDDKYATSKLKFKNGIINEENSLRQANSTKTKELENVSSLSYSALPMNYKSDSLPKNMD